MYKRQNDNYEYYSGIINSKTHNQKDMEEFLGTVVTYMATATDDEYEEIAQTIRHDLVYSQYGQDLSLIHIWDERSLRMEAGMERRGICKDP